MNINQQDQANQIKVEHENLIYLINKEEKTAEIIDFYSESQNIFVPRSINYQSHEYIVINICENAFENSDEMQNIRFASDSELQTIQNNAFACSSFESIEIPSSVTELAEGWCNELFNVTKIHVNPNNQRYSSIDDKYVIGKSSIEKANFDVFIFSVRNIETATIPNFIEIIGSYSFAECTIIQSVEFPDDSKLRMIESNAFLNSSIESITIPSNVTQICEDAFQFTSVKHVEIPEDSKLQIIEANAFYLSLIESITIPSSLVELKEGWCNEVKNVVKISVSPNNQYYSSIDGKYIIGKSSKDKENFDVLVFSVRNIEIATIPNFIEIIGPYAFANCANLRQIEISKDSKLRIIGKSSFSNCDIENFAIPSNVTHICEEAFYDSNKLQIIEFPMDSKLQQISEYSFANTSIEKIVIPSTVTELKDNWCANTSKLISVKVMPENKHYSSIDDKFIIGKSSIEKDKYDILVFAARDIQYFKIPDSIETIGSFAFAGCNSIKQIDFSPKSRLLNIDDFAFYNSSVRKLSIPANVTRIGKSAFFNCEKLRQIDFLPNSHLQTIGEFAFATSGIESIVFPSSLEEMCNNSFYSCLRLNLIEFDKDNKSLIELQSKLSDLDQAIVMF